jgi:small subunit ribosomal protein S19e
LCFCLFVLISLIVYYYNSTVKTGNFKEMCPQDADWYYVRAASLARKVYLRGGTGVGSFSKVYGGRKRLGARPEHFSTGARGVIRSALKQLEEMELIAKKESKK